MNEIEEGSAMVCGMVGVGEGLGAAVVRRFADRSKVALVAGTPEVVAKSAGEIHAIGGVALLPPSDATARGQKMMLMESINRGW